MMGATMGRATFKSEVDRVAPITIVLPDNSDRGFMFYLQCYQGLLIDRSLVY